MSEHMETWTSKSVEEILAGEYCPLPLEVIPNKMGINLCSVSAISWGKLDDGQLTEMKITFLPFFGKD